MYQTIVQIMTDAYWLVDEHGRLLDVNDAYCQLSGYSREELLGMRLPDLDAIESPEIVTAHMQKVLTQGADCFETQHRRKDGRLVEIEISVTVLPGEPKRIISIARDISERKRMEEALRISEERYRLSLANAPVSVATQDRNLRFTWAFNQRTVDPNHVIGKTDADIFPPETARELVALKQQVLETGQEIRRQLWVNSGGQQRFLDLCLAPLHDPAGQVSGIGISTVDLTQQKLTEEALIESQARAQALLEAVPDLIFRLNREGVFLDYKADLRDLYAQDLPSIVGRRNRDIAPPEFADLIDEQLKRTLETGQMQIFEYSLPIPGRGLRRYEARMAASGADSVTAIVRDITERKQIEEQMAQNARDLKMAQHYSHVGSWIWDIANGRLEWSDEMYLIYGLDPAGFTGDLAQVIARAIHPDDRPAIEASNRSVIEQKKPYPVEYRVVWPDGSLHTVWAEAGELILDEQGRPSLLKGYTQDITERKQIENELRAQYAALQDAQARLLQSEKLASIGQLVAGVAHELNNPLTSVILFSQLIQTRCVDSQIQSDLEKIVAEAQRAARIVRGLLDFARQRPAAMRPTDLNQLLSTSLEMIAYELRTRNIQSELHLDPHLPAAMVDTHQFQQVLVNLFQNAWQALGNERSDSRLSVASSYGPARFQAANDPARSVIRITVSDNGPGIPETLLARIFDPFFSTKPVGQGTGLGLSICHGIIAEHGGHIWAENLPGGGAQFVIELPAVG